MGLFVSLLCNDHMSRTLAAHCLYGTEGVVFFFFLYVPLYACSAFSGNNHFQEPGKIMGKIMDP